MWWEGTLRCDPVGPLLETADGALEHFVRRDLVDERDAPPPDLARLPEPSRLLGRQQPDGAWRPPASQQARKPAVDCRLIETWKHLRILIGKYGLDRTHPGIGLAAEHVLSCQAREGDIRGMLAGQQAMYYTGALLGLLIRAGYAEDARVLAGMEWLLAMRQDDGGWVGTPFQTVPLSGADIAELTTRSTEPFADHDRTRPFSHNWTGMVLRAFAAHPRYRRCEAAQRAAELLASRFFQPDAYRSYGHADNWLRFQYPYWWNHLLAALDVVVEIGLGMEDANVARAVAWFADNQEPSGLWRASYSTIHRRPDPERTVAEARWISYAIARVLKRLL